MPISEIITTSISWHILFHNTGNEAVSDSLYSNFVGPFFGVNEY
jgi:hypothetical protein